MARKTTPIPESISTRTKASSTKVPAKRHKKAEMQAAPEPPATAETAFPVSHEAVARLAFLYWEQRGYQHGSAEADWVRAERELLSVNA